MPPSSRRQFLARLGGGTALALNGTGCDRFYSAASEWLGQTLPARLPTPEGDDVDPAFHLLSRAAFGPWPGDWKKVSDTGPDAWLEQQLQPDSIDDSACQVRARRFESLHASPGDAFEFKKDVLREEIQRHALLRAIYSRRQLHEVMVEFWTDHLNIDLNKGDCVYLKPSDDREVIRPHALGRFRDLIRASATSPAMLVYLDGASNKVRRGTDDKPNENYARELLELHTLGVNGGYSQADVSEAARCLSGWTFSIKRKRVLNRGRSYFRTDWHDNGVKRVLGETIPASGQERDLEHLIDVVCTHPSTARHIALKLCRRFIEEDPSASVVDEVAAVFSLTDGDIASTLRAVFRSDAFRSSQGKLFKRPFRFLVSALRGLGADTHGHTDAREPLTRMGQPLFQYPTPDGYPQEPEPWLGTIMWRWNTAVQLTSGGIPDVRVDLPRLRLALMKGGATDIGEAAFAHLTGRLPTQQEWQSIQQAAKSGSRTTGSANLVAVILASPAFQRC